MSVTYKEETKQTQCAHCGEICDQKKGLSFCCFACEQVFLLLKENNLEQYYQIEKHPGISRLQRRMPSYAFLRTESTAERLLSFKDSSCSKVNLTLPAIHCSSCLWLLEHLPKLDRGIFNCKVDFIDKKAYITFDHSLITLEEVVSLLAKIGYEAELNFGSLTEKLVPKTDRSLLLKIGVAGFSFGNIMLLSFPEYLGFENASNNFYLGYLNILLALPVFFYAGFDFIKAGYQDLRHGHIGIHIPLAIGMLTLFLRSVFEIFTNVGEGYLDSFAGFVFFLLVGQWFQNQTQKSIRFDRDYKSYFPIAVQTLKEGSWFSNTIDQISEGDIIKIKNNEIIPCDGILQSGRAHIDYSFVTGESTPQNILEGQKIYAGGRQKSEAIQIKVTNSVDQGYLTQLWKEAPFKDQSSSQAEKLLNHISKYFTFIILTIATLTFTYWAFKDPNKAFSAATAVLIVACPCALALSVPFILGNASRILSKFQFYVKSSNTLEKLLDIDTIVFDKTGTITENHSITATYSGNPLNNYELDLIYSLTSQSNHPLSTAVAQTISGESYQLQDYKEVVGQGVSAICNGKRIRIGSSEFIFGSESHNHKNVIVEIDHNVVGYYTLEKKLRPKITEVIGELCSYKLALLSGDNDNDKSRMQKLFPHTADLHFNQSPKDKLTYIKNLQESGATVLMIGDGLNDAGALKQSDVGLVLAENNNTFTPSCDAIISSKKLAHFIKILSYLRKLKHALYGAFIMAFAYNIVGIGYAITGNLSPIIAAILMPASSITIMIYGLVSSKCLSRILDISDLSHDTG